MLQVPNIINIAIFKSSNPNPVDFWPGNTSSLTLNLDAMFRLLDVRLVDLPWQTRCLTRMGRGFGGLQRVKAPPPYVGFAAPVVELRNSAKLPAKRRELTDFWRQKARGCATLDIPIIPSLSPSFFGNCRLWHILLLQLQQRHVASLSAAAIAPRATLPTKLDIIATTFGRESPPISSSQESELMQVTRFGNYMEL